MAAVATNRDVHYMSTHHLCRVKSANHAGARRRIAGPAAVSPPASSRPAATVGDAADRDPALRATARMREFRNARVTALNRRGGGHALSGPSPDHRVRRAEEGRRTGIVFRE